VKKFTITLSDAYGRILSVNAEGKWDKDLLRDKLGTGNDLKAIYRLQDWTVSIYDQTHIVFANVHQQTLLMALRVRPYVEPSLLAQGGDWMLENSRLKQVETVPKKMGIVVNPSKTEVIVFDENPVKIPFSIDGTMAESGTTVKALGITLHHNLKWTVHLEQIIKRIAPKLSMLKKIRKNLDLQQFLKIATSQLFSVLYYASQL